MSKTAVIAMGRFGDVISVLPCIRDIALREGGKCAVFVSAEFASVLEGCSYVEAVVVDEHFTDYLPAIEQARQQFERVLVSKVNERNVAQCEAFNQEAWRQLGYLERWNDDLPLVFDRRDGERERQLIADCRFAIADCGPLVLVNFSGKSAPYPYASEVRSVIDRRYRVVDLAEVRAHRIYDLLGLMDAADLLITGDTSTLHLAAASRVPVVNLIGETPTRWHGSKPRNNSVLEIRYSERERLGEIAEVLRGTHSTATGTVAIPILR